jgi:hypothetical protein
MKRIYRALRRLFASSSLPPSNALSLDHLDRRALDDIPPYHPLVNDASACERC